MEDFTDFAYRTLAYKCGADMTFTEMTSIEALADGQKYTIEKIKIPDDTPTIIQLAGNKEGSLEKFLGFYKPENGFKGFNLNLGCPNPEIINKGMGAAMIKRIAKVSNMISIIKKHGYGTSIKMRLGLNAFEKEKKVYLKLIESVDADFFIVHARHGKQTYEEKADFSVYEEIAKTGKTIIANGDIKSKEDIDLLKSVGIKGAMIGREATRDPRIFSMIKGIDLNINVKDTYLNLTEKFNSPLRYRNNVFKRLIV
jgi:tRNA-dihydrouridine synthase